MKKIWVIVLILHVSPILSCYYANGDHSCEDIGYSLYERKKTFALEWYMERFKLKKQPFFKGTLHCPDGKGDIFIVTSNEGVSFLKITDNYHQLVGLLRDKRDKFEIMYITGTGYRYRLKDGKLLKRRIRVK